MSSGAFFGFSGMFADGPANVLDGVVFVDDVTGQRSFFIPNSQAGVSHPVSFAASSDALYIADLAVNGNFTQGGQGVIYRVSVSTVPEPSSLALVAAGLVLTAGLGRRRFVH